MLNTLKTTTTQLQKSIVGGAVIIGVSSILSRVLGLLRDRLLSSTFGVGDVLDSYFTAFKVPDFLFNLLVLGVISASFVPVFIEQKEKKGNAWAMEVASAVLNIVLSGLAVLALVCAVFAPQFAAIIAPGETALQREQTVLFMRFLLIALLFFGMSNVLAGVLHANKRFFVYALAPLLYNLGIIFGIVVLVPLIGVVGLPVGVVGGAAAHALVQLPTARAEGFRYRFTLGFGMEPVRRILLLAPPRAFALGLTQLNTIILFGIASTVGTGARSVFQFADNLQHFPINIFGVSLALAAFPVFSEALGKNDIEKYKQVFSENFRRILFFIIPISIATLLLRSQIVRLVYGAGMFDWDATITVAQLLGIFTLSMFAQAVIPLLTRSYFAKQDTVTPVLMSIVAVIMSTALALMFSDEWGVYGIGFAYSVAALAHMLLLLLGLRIRFGNLDDARIIDSVWKILVASFVMAAVIQGLKYAVVEFVELRTWFGIALQTSIALFGGAVVYISMARKFHFAEAEQVYARFRQIIQTLRRILWKP